MSNSFSHEAEPMDLDLSSELAQSCPSPMDYQVHSGGHSSGEMSFHSQHDSPTKFDLLGFSRLSTRDDQGSDTRQSKEQSFPNSLWNRPKTTPPMKSFSIDESKNVNNKDKMIRSMSTLPQSFPSTDRSHDICRKRKIGYGIPDSDFTFSHYPNSPAKTKRSPKTPVRRNVGHGHGKDVTKESSNKIGEKNFCGMYFRILVFIIVMLIIGIGCMLFNFKSFSLFPSLSCDNSPIHLNLTALKLSLKTELFGQHLATEVIEERLKRYSHMLQQSNISELPNSDFQTSYSQVANVNINDCRPLVLSFHGWTGVGKTFISQLVSRAFNRESLNLRLLIIPLLIPYETSEQAQAELIRRKIIDEMSKCKMNVFIIDEMDKAPPSVVNGLTDTLRNFSTNCTFEYPAIFLLLSNTHALDVNVRYRSLLLSSQVKIREDVMLSHFESIFQDSHQWYSRLADKGLVDAFVPFLPLEKHHVTLCIERELTSKNILVSRENVEAVLKELRFTEGLNVGGDKTEEIMFSVTGCKRVRDKVDFVFG